MTWPLQWQERVCTQHCICAIGAKGYQQASGILFSQQHKCAFVARNFVTTLSMGVTNANKV
jgi:hypothetical protein